MVSLRKVGKKIRKFSMRNSTSNSSLVHKGAKVVSTLRIWMIALWAFAVLGFLAIMSVVLSGHKGNVTRSKNYRNKRRSFYSGFSDADGSSHQLHD